MARAAYNDTICSIAADGTMKAISNVQVTVKKVSDGTNAQIWNDRTGTAPGNEVSNPFVTASTGLVRFYAAPAEYTIHVHDLNAPARIADDVIPWDAASGAQSPEEFGFAMGDLKISAQEADHGRWLKCNGRELTQAEIESALSVAAGQALAFTNFMGTGGSSKYGAAASSKVKLPDTRRRALIGAGRSADSSPTPPAGTTARDPGAAGGVETVTLTGQQSGIASHTHAPTDPGHSHTATQPSHNHTITDPGHNHGSQTFNTRIALFGFDQTNFGSGGSKKGVVEASTEYDDLDADTGTVFNHAGAQHTHGIPGGATGISLATAQPAITVSSVSTGITIATIANTSASQSHDNMPPYIAVGWVFIRI